MFKAYRSRRLVLLLACAGLILLLPAPARADVGVAPILPGGLTLQPEGQTTIQMAAEQVVMTVRAATPADNAAILLSPDAYGYAPDKAWFQAAADVQADFHMHNPSNEPVRLQTWFPLASTLARVAWFELNPDESVPRIEGFEVRVDGVAVATTLSELPNPDGADLPPLPWASFPVTYTASAETLIQVRYVLPLSQPAKSRDLVLYYIFQTGAGWSGSIGQAELVIHLPYPASPETLSGMPADSLRPPYFVYMGKQAAPIPPGAVLEGSQARWTWTDFEPGPEDDFALLLMHPAVWESLQAARAAVEESPQDGAARFRLCKTYAALSERTYHASIPASYAAAFLPLVEPACQEAARLLPGDGAPYYLLASYSLALLQQSPSLLTLRPALVALQVAQALEAVQPPSEVNLCRYWEDEGNAACLATYIASAYPVTPAPEWLDSVSQEAAGQVEAVFAVLTATASAAAPTEAARTALARPSDTALPTRTAPLTATSTATGMAASTQPPQPSSTQTAVQTPLLTGLASPTSPALPAGTGSAGRWPWEQASGLWLLLAVGAVVAVAFLVRWYRRR